MEILCRTETTSPQRVCCRWQIHLNKSTKPRTINLELSRVTNKVSLPLKTHLVDYVLLELFHHVAPARPWRQGQSRLDSRLRSMQRTNHGLVGAVSMIHRQQPARVVAFGCSLYCLMRVDYLCLSHVLDMCFCRWYLHTLFSQACVVFDWCSNIMLSTDECERDICASHCERRYLLFLRILKTSSRSSASWLYGSQDGTSSALDVPTNRRCNTAKSSPRFRDSVARPSVDI